MERPEEIPQDVLDRMAKEKVARQFRDIFGCPPKPGEPEKRTESQIAVYENLRRAGNMDHISFMPDRNGALCPMRAGIAEGQRWMFLYIQANVEYTPPVS